MSIYYWNGKIKAFLKYVIQEPDILKIKKWKTRKKYEPEVVVNC